MRPLFSRLAAAPALALALALASALAAGGCGNDFDRASKLSSLRVLAVRSDQPFAAPGDRPHLEALVVDASPAADPRPASFAWLGGCVNPPGDAYHECYPHLHALASKLGDQAIASGTLPADLPPGLASFGTSFDMVVPDGILTGRSTPDVVNPYGVVYTFFIACKGELRRDPGADPANDFPLGCFVPGSASPVGPDDVVVGYHLERAFAQLRNQNPVIDGLALDGLPLPKASCDESAPCPAGQRCDGGSCLPVIARCEGDGCPSHAFSALLSPSSVERAVSAEVPPEAAPDEAVWVTYYATAGSLDHDTRSFSNPGEPLSTDIAAGFTPPGDGGRRARLFAVARDSRGGIDWKEADVWIE